MLEEIKMNLDKEIKLILENAGVKEPLLTDDLKKKIDIFVEKYMSVNPHDLQSFKQFDEPPEDYWDEEEEFINKCNKFLALSNNRENEHIWWSLMDDFNTDWIDALTDEQYEQFKNEVREYVQSKVDDYESYTHEYYY